ncbi:MAG: hypothetical protein ABI891_15315 [Acidobacteriota bacterium]
MTIIQTLTEKGFTLALEGGRLAITPKANLTDALREFIRANKKKLVSELQSEKESNLVSAVIRSDEFRHFPENNGELADYKAERFYEVLNRFIEKGITFDVSENDFQVIDARNVLKISDREFLKLNDAAILCQLQQSLLMKHLFNHSPERLCDFAFEITERETLLTITAKTSFEIYFEAVKQVTRIWFADLLKNYD